MRKEREVEIKLHNWLKNYGSYIKAVYFNSKNELDCEVFVTKGKINKPDIIIKIDRGFGEEYIAVEVKTADNDRNVLDSGKILDYYLDYITGQTAYYINCEEIKIKYFLVATENSINGYLFKNESIIINNLTEKPLTKMLAEIGLLPSMEYERTRQFTRGLVAEFSRFRKRNELKIKPSLGILMSDFWNEKSPHIFVISYIDYLDKKARWGQRFIKI
jgi:hypothetical protein